MIRIRKNERGQPENVGLSQEKLVDQRVRRNDPVQKFSQAKGKRKLNERPLRLFEGM